MDTIVRSAWIEAGAPGALFATGGYGRCELYPASDIDLAVLLTDPVDRAQQAAIESFVQRLWDLGLKVGSAVRTLRQTRDAVMADVATFTALTEARYLAGDQALGHCLESVLGGSDVWPFPAYLQAKERERRKRYRRYDSSAERLEPSVKESPGGLRDLATISWIGARRLGRLRADFAALERGGLIAGVERRKLVRARHVLSRIRLGLHQVANRPEERLLFDLQPKIADLLGYQGRRGALAVESMMQDYYRAARDVAHVSALLFSTLAASPMSPEPLAPGLVRRGTEIEFEHPDTLPDDLHPVLKIFRYWQIDPGLTALTASAYRAIAEQLPKVDSDFRRDPENRAAFASLLTGTNRVAASLRALHDVGVLDRYLPAFARIRGRMQYDLFHVFTVDEHILRVVANIEELLGSANDRKERLELRTAVERIDRPEVMYLTALFHDIAKGRGGDHSTLGARQVRLFARQHGLSASDADLAAWLVRHHLTLSLTAQKSDLTDRRVIASFARLVGDQRRLDYLYVLTAADVHATNPALWNAWRQTLFAQLYLATSRVLWRGFAHPVDAEAEISARKIDARKLLGGASPTVSRLWNSLGENYFLQYNAEEIAWHTRSLLAAQESTQVFARAAPDGAGTAIAVYANRRTFAFARVTAALAQLGLSIVAARCVPVGRDASLDTYVVTEADGQFIEDRRRLERIESLLAKEMTRESREPRRVTRLTPRQVRLFPTPTRIEFGTDPDGHQTVLELIASDRPGLLAAVARAFKCCEVYLRTAKVMTAGERAEDVFHVTDAEDRPLGRESQEALERILTEEIASEK